MNAIIFTSDQFDKLYKAIEEIRIRVTHENKQPKEQFIDNHELCMLLKISKRTAQSWRDEGRIGYTQVGSKIYYKLGDIDKLLQSGYVKPVKNNF